MKFNARNIVLGGLAAGQILAGTCALAWTSSTYYGYTTTFGTTPSSRSGEKGRSGYSGPSVTLDTRNGGGYYNLAGDDGSSGSDGYHGEDARSCQQYYYTPPNNNQEGARGGDGGDGGAGGNGGAGGDATIYYDSLADLSTLTIHSRGGRGGRGGDGANRGGDGCECRLHSWLSSYCSSSTSICTTRYYCTDGRQGGSGRRGDYGLDGSNGSILLIKHPLRVVENTTASRSIKVSDFQRQDYKLTRNLFSDRRGALALLGSDSEVQDLYKEYKGLATKTVSLMWSADSDVDQFGGNQIHISLDSNGDLSVGTDSDFFVEFTVSTDPEDEDHQTIEVTRAIPHEVLKQMKYTNYWGKEKNFTLVLQESLDDPADEFETEYHVYARKKVRDITVWNGWIEAKDIEQEGDLRRIKLGVPADNDKLEKGTNLEVTIKVARKWKGHRMEFKVLDSHYIKVGG